MIGQKNLKDKIDKIIDRFPTFFIVQGPKGSGKKTLCSYIAYKLGLTTLQIGTKIEDIRNLIDLAYNHSKPTLFIISNAENMSVAAKNSLLKITEEPPKNSYFVLTVCNLDLMLDTLKSRASIFSLEDYSKQELIEYRKFMNYSSGYDDIILDVCMTTGDVNELFGYNIPEFYTFAKKVADNIHIPRNGNTFKLTSSIKTKENEQGFDAALTLKAIRNLFFKKGLETKDTKYLQATKICGSYLSMLTQPTLNKLSILDLWIVDVRKVLF